MDNSDDFIVKHHGHMTMREMADHLGLSKSTVSRRVANLKANGAIDDAAAQDAKRNTQRARDTLESCGMSDLDRIEALRELLDKLREELSVTGGANLARVSSEYRRTLEEITAISKNIEIAEREGHVLNTLEATRLKVSLRHEYHGAADSETVLEIIESTLLYLNDMGVISYKPLTRILSQAELAESEGEDDEEVRGEFGID